MPYFIGTSIVINDSSAYVHESFSTTGIGTTYIKISKPVGDSGDYFGHAVSVGSQKIVVGAWDDFSDGSAHIYDLDGTNEVKITASDGSGFDNFGYSVSVGCGKIVVGAYGDDFDRGSVYIYDLDGTNEVKITASDRSSGDSFGYSVAVDNGRIVVGAPLDDVNAGNSGSIYIFDLYGNQLHKIVDPDGLSGNYFGISVAVGSGRIVAGATEQGRTNLLTGGKAHIFDLEGDNRIEIQGADIDAEDNFGITVSVASGKIIVGANNKNPNAVYVFDLNGNQLNKISAPDSAEDIFSQSCAISDGKIVIGDHSQNTNNGAAFIFDYPEDSNTYWETIMDTYKY